MLRHAEALADRITGLAMEVQAGTGPGLDAEAYQRGLCLDLANAGLLLNFNTAFMADGIKRLVT